MQVVKELEKTLAEYPPNSSDTEELARLRDFLQRMKEAGVARTREYDLPQPDTLGRALVEGAKRAT